MIQEIIDNLLLLARERGHEVKEIRMHPEIKVTLIREIGGLAKNIILGAQAQGDRYQGYPVKLDYKVLLEVKI